MNNIAQLKKEVEEAFGSQLTVQQLWTLAKYAKHVRFRCRNNAAFNNFNNQMFPHARFQQVPKSREKNGVIERYEGLQITVRKSDGQVENSDNLNNESEDWNAAFYSRY